MPCTVCGVCSLLISSQNAYLNRALNVFTPELPRLDAASNFTRFPPPSAEDTPETLFAARIPRDATIPAPRLTRISNPREFLIYTDGSCMRNGADDAAGGCAFVFRPETSISTIPPRTSSGHDPRAMNLHTRGVCRFRLEAHGPNGEAAERTSNRAELRATIAALQFRFWTGEGFQRLIIATDSSYVVGGCTEWVRKWQQNGWNTAAGKPVRNRDLWEEIIKEMDSWSERGMEVQFWLIPRSLNSVADSLAKEAAGLPAQENWNRIYGVAC
ncbi:ribonuclease H-like protein [Viridothelium virens]|uniref:ribonuclease H n=1 Tax=Viridothelium virens TaxID=1048519 RepID=A0A6A6GZ67_VIRVR|nr:ribonuclease H-like protein [Viridothelium virens]